MKKITVLVICVLALVLVACGGQSEATAPAPETTLTPIPETTPAVETTPIVETTPTVETTPIVETTPTVETTQIIETTPIPETTPIVETTPTVETTPMPETTPIIETTPAPETGVIGMEVSAPSYLSDSGSYVYEVTMSENEIVLDGLFDSAYADGIFLTATNNLPDGGSYFNVYFKADSTYLYVFYEVIKNESIFYSEDYIKRTGCGHHLDCANLVLDVQGREAFNNNEMHILAGIEGGRDTAVVKNDPADRTRANNWYVKHTARGYNVEISYPLRVITGADASGDKMISFLAIATITTGWPDADAAPVRKYPYVTNAGGETNVDKAKSSPSLLVIKETAGLEFPIETNPVRPGANYGVPSELRCEVEVDSGHIQGMAIDDKNGYIYYSFSGDLVKADFEGNIIGTVDGISGHLGCVSYDPDRNRLYGSLELKGNNTFYLISFNCENINEIGMSVTDERVARVVRLSEVCYDFSNNDPVSGERYVYGCSGIDGVAYGKEFGEGGEMKIMVAYGIFQNNDRTDNDYQVILQYSPSIVDDYGKPLNYSDLPTSGPESAENRYFFYTGNTNYGIQNLEYDEYKNVYIVAVYKGSKEEFTNFNMFFIDAGTLPTLRELHGRNGETGLVLEQADLGTEGLNGIKGSNFAYGSMGTCSLGDGTVYFSTSSSGTVVRYRWSEKASDLFERTGW